MVHPASTVYERAPHCPGVYKMFDVKGHLLYVGKAKDLRKRLSSYFQPKERLSIKTAALMRRVVDLQWLEVASESAALVLENELIKAHKPPYNIALRDDKSYYYLVEDPSHAFPALRLERRAKKWQEGVNYYGPYPSSTAVKRWLNQLQKWFLIRQCSDAEFKTRKRPCMQHQLGRCSAPCVGKISSEEYMAQFDLVRACLRGASKPILDRCQKHMQSAADALDYEGAAMWRDMIQQMQLLNLQGRRKTDEHADVFVAISDGDVSIYAIGWVRFGVMQDIQAYEAPNPLGLSHTDALAALIPQFYMQHENWHGAPNRILLEEPIAEGIAMESWLKTHHGQKISLKARLYNSDEKRWLAQVRRHAHNKRTHGSYHPSTCLQSAPELMQALNLQEAPRHTECLDVSHSAGKFTYASCVCFNENGPSPKQYRTCRIEKARASDDYGALKEALGKFYQKCAKGLRPWPELIIIDGGRGQLSAAMEVWQASAWPMIPIMSISKGPERRVGEEWLHIPDQPAIKLPAHHEALRWIQHLRDESHRFALKSHRRAQAKAARTSILEQVPGIGPKLRQALLMQFGGLQGLRQASLEQLTQAPGLGVKVAKALYDALHEQGSH